MRLDASNFEQRVIKSEVPVLIQVIVPRSSRNLHVLAIQREARGWMMNALGSFPGQLKVGKLNFEREPRIHRITRLHRLRRFPLLLLFRPGASPTRMALWGVCHKLERELARLMAKSSAIADPSREFPSWRKNDVLWIASEAGFDSWLKEALAAHVAVPVRRDYREWI